MKVNDLMTESPIAVGPETPLKEVAAILVEYRISGLPVVDDDQRVLGVVSEADIIVQEGGPEPRHGGIMGWLLTGGTVDARLAARTAGEAMSSPAITSVPHWGIAEAACTMTDQGIKRLPVVDSDDRLVGILTRADLVRAFARSDAEIEREIREDVVIGAFWIENQDLDVRVEQGNVRLSGRLIRRTDAELLPAVVARVPGVVSVHSTLRWHHDDRGLPLDELESSLGPLRRM